MPREKYHVKMEAVLELCCCKPRNARSHQRLEEARKNSSLEHLGEAWPSQHPDFILPASRTWREYIFVVFKPPLPQFVVICYGSPRKVILPLISKLESFFFLLFLHPWMTSSCILLIKQMHSDEMHNLVFPQANKFTFICVQVNSGFSFLRVPLPIRGHPSTTLSDSSIYSSSYPLFCSALSSFSPGTFPFA